MLLIGGTGGDTRDGDPDPAGVMPPSGGRLDGVVPVRYDKRGCGYSGGAVAADYDVDTADAVAHDVESTVRTELILSTERARHDIVDRDPVAELASVTVATLVLHGGEDLNVRVTDALDTYRALRAAGNHTVELAVLPGLDHHLRTVAADRITRVWERISQASLHHPIEHRALDLVATWLRRTLVS